MHILPSLSGTPTRDLKIQSVMNPSIQNCEPKQTFSFYKLIISGILLEWWKAD
jgi:hypothetical protein